MTPLETKLTARVAELEAALRSMRTIAKNAVEEQARFLADGLVYGVDRVFAQAGIAEDVEPCRGHPCRMVTKRVNESMCPPCAREFARRFPDGHPSGAACGAVLHRSSSYAGDVLSSSRTVCVLSTGHAGDHLFRAGPPTDCHGFLTPVGDCPKPALPGGWPCALHDGHSGDCAEVPFA